MQRLRRERRIDEPDAHRQPGQVAVGPSLRSDNHDLWVVVTQDCDLYKWKPTDLDPVVEIRPVFLRNPPQDWGIRSAKLRLNGELYMEADQPRLHLSPAALTTFESGRRAPLSNDRIVALKTWLGKRYDRPAVPSELVALSKEIGTQLRHVKAEDRAAVHDVLAQFMPGTPPQYALAAIVTNEADKQGIYRWIAEAASRVDENLGVLGGVTVPTKAEATLDLIENSYSMDLSQITWRGEGPTGAV